ncbi:C39 family peptidase [Paenibacillus hexagrammi]|uniref:C39 family peptidase n=1 Tax=Paenibacillus hexagrammi TaxID=2908839 RepID=A0ABY3SFX8_9BACL|nr:C39 family peptidase [Paenibacillus sp. YPD9-1]UJF32872.1 C39 family peptidase [Paenibacillus sp. YPD9-1]
MKLFKPAKILVLALSISSIFSSIPVFASDLKDNYVPEKISPEAAMKAAAWQMISETRDGSDISEWSKDNTKLRVAKPIEVYDPSGEHVAYLVNSFNGDRAAGYVMVSAFLDDEPIIAWSDSGDGITTDKFKNALNKNKNEIKKQELVWFGGVDIGGKFIYNDNSVSMINVEGKELKEIKSKTINEKDEKYPKPVKINDNYREDWKAINKIVVGAPGQNNPSDGVSDIDPNGWEANYLSIDKNYINTSVNQKQWYYTTSGGVQQATGCSPTAGSNIMKYWSDKGYTSLVPVFQTQVVSDLRATMGTTQSSNRTGVTSPSNIDDGLQAYARAHQRPSAISKNDNLSNFSAVKTEIDAQRPALQSYWNQTYFGDHTVTLVGYKHYIRNFYTQDSYYVVARNNFVNDSTFNVWVKWGTWNTNVLTTFTP